MPDTAGTNHHEHLGDSTHFHYQIDTPTQRTGCTSTFATTAFATTASAADTT